MKHDINLKAGERGITLLVSTLSLAFVIPMVGLAVDVGYLYAVKTRLQASVDGAALAAARALNLGESTAAQATAAKQNAYNWFMSNFPPGNWMTSNTMIAQNDTAYMEVWDDPVNPNLRNVRIRARTDVPTFFMRYLSFNTTTIEATGLASRRDVVAMMVLDRSGSMCGSASRPCDDEGACGPLKSAAKIFTGQFAAGRDRIGLVTYADNIVVHEPPTQDFQDLLGYTNGFGSDTGHIDNIVCDGGTNMPAAIALAHNELRKINLPGALNVIMFETDGLPNMITVNVNNTTSSRGIADSSNCRDRNGLKKSAGGFTGANTFPFWQGDASNPAVAMGAQWTRGDVPAGMTFGIGGTDTGTSFFRPFKVFTDVPYPNSMLTLTGSTFSSGSPACMPAGSTSSVTQDLESIPGTDVFGNQMHSIGYKSVTTSTGAITSITAAQIRNAAFNASDQAANYARADADLKIYVFGLGLNAGTTIDHVLMQRLANDPNGDSAVPYPACASASGCTTRTDQLRGTYVYAPNASSLGSAFLKLSAQILRLSQ